MSDFESRFLGPGSALEKFIAVIESVAFLLRVNVDEMRRSPPTIQRLVVTGGLARSTYFCQCLADLVELEVLRMEEAEASARGVACLAAGLPESWRAAAARTLAPQRNGPLLARYVAWLRSLKASLRNA